MEAEPNDVLIMGAGPAGLTAAWELMKHQIPVKVLEKDARYVGGLARTVEHNGYRFDIGGHRFFSKNQEIEDTWTEILGDEMLTRGRLSTSSSRSTGAPSTGPGRRRGTHPSRRGCGRAPARCAA